VGEGLRQSDRSTYPDRTCDGKRWPVPCFHDARALPRVRGDQAQGERARVGRLLLRQAEHDAIIIVATVLGGTVKDAIARRQPGGINVAVVGVKAWSIFSLPLAVIS